MYNLKNFDFFEPEYSGYISHILVAYIERHIEAVKELFQE